MLCRVQVDRLSQHRQVLQRAASLDPAAPRLKLGIAIAPSSAMITTTITSSIKLNPLVVAR